MSVDRSSRTHGPDPGVPLDSEEFTGLAASARPRARLPFAGRPLTGPRNPETAGAIDGDLSGIPTAIHSLVYVYARHELRKFFRLTVNLCQSNRNFAMICSILCNVANFETAASRRLDIQRSKGLVGQSRFPSSPAPAVLRKASVPTSARKPGSLSSSTEAAVASKAITTVKVAFRKMVTRRPSRRQASAHFLSLSFNSSRSPSFSLMRCCAFCSADRATSSS